SPLIRQHDAVSSPDRTRQSRRSTTPCPKDDRFQLLDDRVLPIVPQSSMAHDLPKGKKEEIGVLKDRKALDKEG
ncbi:MAG: hypothetical protein VX470_10935, partial [Planctomycetota bacterium]|nr:hypothetical protein [Planctomycetota bacterium]